MGHVFERGRVLWVAFADASGRRRRVSTYIPAGETAGEKRRARAAAERVLALHEQREEASRAAALAGPPTVERWAVEVWLPARRRSGLLTVDDDESRLANHLFPALGLRPLVEVTRQEIRDLFLSLQAGGKLAPRSIHNLYGLCHVLFEDAVAEGMRDLNPCTLRVRRGELPPKEDRDPAWRSRAVYSRQEARRLCLDESIPELYRVIYALAFLAGMRIGEVVARRWRDLDYSREPLHGLEVLSAYSSRDREERGTKTRAVRIVPVHPELARVLAEWRLLGWEEETGRRPADDDLIVPASCRRSSEGRPRNSRGVLKALHHHCEQLGIRPRRTHDARRSFISWLRAAPGANDRLIKWITHGRARRGVLDDYFEPPWKDLCDQVSAMRLDLRPAEVVPVRSATKQ